MASKQSTTFDFAWKPVVGFERLYEVSNCGHVRSLKRTVKVRRNGRTETRAVQGIDLQKTDSHGYAMVNLCRNGIRFPMRVHRMVAEAFIGRPPIESDCCHNNGDKWDNRVENLRWDSRKGNMADKKAHGTSQCGEKHGLSVLTVLEVHQIRLLRSAGVQRKILALAFGVSPATITMVVQRKRWAHVA